MADEKGTILTESGLKKLEEQLDYLISVRRNEISEQIAVARGFGDLSENAEYDEAKKEQAKVEAGVLADVAPSILHIMGLEQPEEMTGKCLISD